MEGLQHLFENMNTGTFATNRIRILPEDLVPEKPEWLETIHFIKCMEQYNEPKVYNTYKRCRTRGLAYVKEKVAKTKANPSTATDDRISNDSTSATESKCDVAAAAM